jgi:hypothetical protein
VNGASGVMIWVTSSAICSPVSVELIEFQVQTGKNNKLSDEKSLTS